MPVEVNGSLRQVHLPARALSAVVREVDGSPQALLNWQSARAVNPASVMKLVTTYASLQRLGPGFTWKTQVTALGQLQGSVLRGHVLIRGGGDPKLVVERLQPILQALRDAGIQRIEGDIILDRRAFALAPTDPATGVARVAIEPPLSGMQMDTAVPLSQRACGDWRADLRASVHAPDRMQFAGTYPASCGERVWPTAYADPASHSARAIAGMWGRVGGVLTGQVRDWATADLPLDHMSTVWGRSFESLPLADIVHDVNKFSNNVMAQHLLLTLGLQGEPEMARSDTRAAGRKALLTWWKQSLPQEPAPVLDNGSGLSRVERIRADALAALLVQAALSPVATVFMGSLPVAGQDVALSRRPNLPAGQARLKTGTLKDVVAIAGYVRSNSGRQYVVVGIINHPQAAAGRPVLDALVNWVAQDAPVPPTPARKNKVRARP